MQRISVTILLVLTALLAGCATIGSASQIFSTSGIHFFPERVLHNPDHTAFAIAGYSYDNGKNKPCYFVISKETIDTWKTKNGEVMLSRIGIAEAHEVKLSSGTPPSSFSPASTIVIPNQSVAVGTKKSFHPQFIALLPFTLVVDVATSPLQAAVARGLDFMN